MAKYTFSRLSSLVNGVSAINGVITQIESAFNDTLSRSGKSPNQMTADLDMNSKRILNLPVPTSQLEPVRLTDLQTAINTNFNPSDESTEPRYHSDTVAAFYVTAFHPEVHSVSILGYYSIGVGSLNVRRTATEPTHTWKFRSADRYKPDETYDAVNGGWWEGIAGDNIDVKAFGAYGDNTHDDTTYIQNAINYCLTYKHALHLTAGVYRITSTLTYGGVTGIITFGDGIGLNTGAAVSMLVWDGDAVSPMIQMYGCPFSVFEYFSVITQNNSKPLLAFIRSTATAQYNGVNVLKTHNTFRNIFIEGGNQIDKGFVFDAGPGYDGNNDLNLFEKLWITNCKTAMVSFEHSQSLGHTFVDCQFNGHGNTLYGVTTGIGTSGNQAGNGGSFNWMGGLCSLMKTAAFHIGDSVDSFVIQNVTCENTPCFLMTKSNWAVSNPITLIGCIVRGSGQNIKVINYTAGGPLTVIGCHFVSDNAGGIQIYMGPQPTLNVVPGTAIGNRFYRQGTADPFVTSSNVRWTRINNCAANYLVDDHCYTPLNTDDNTAVQLDPRNVGRLKLDLDPSLAWSVTASSGNISQILDQSGNNNTATQAGAGKPTLVTAGLNGLDTIRFTRANSQFFSLTSGIDLTNGATIIAVVRNLSYAEFLGKNGDTTKFSLIWESNYPYMAVSNKLKGYMSYVSRSDTASYHVLVGVTDGTQVGTNVYYDGVAVSTQGNVSSAGTQCMASFDQVGYGDGQYSDMYLARLCVWDRALSSQDISGITAFLKAKYGLS